MAFDVVGQRAWAAPSWTWVSSADINNADAILIEHEPDHCAVASNSNPSG